MPRELHEKLKKIAAKKIRKGTLSPKKKNAYVFGTMRKTGWKPNREM